MCMHVLYVHAIAACAELVMHVTCYLYQSIFAPPIMLLFFPPTLKKKTKQWVKLTRLQLV